MSMPETIRPAGAKPADRKTVRQKRRSVRFYVQAFFFALIALIAVNHTLAESGGGIPFLSQASLHAICPFGGVVSLYQLFSLGTYVQKIHAGSVILMGIMAVLALLFGPVFCGWVCPLGSIQEWFGKLGRKLFKQRYNHIVPEKADWALRWFRYAVLLWVVYMTARSGTLVFSSLDPYQALFNFWSAEVAPTALIVLGATLGLSLIVERPWCRYACPYGALLGLSNKIRIFRIRRQPATCISCGKCDRVCPMNLDIANKETVSAVHCISCFECTSERSCPVPDTVSLQSPALRQPASQPQKEALS